MKKITAALNNNLGKVEISGPLIEVAPDPAWINPAGISLLYRLINEFQDTYFITIRNLPYCLMPDATEHIVYKKDACSKHYYDSKCKSCYLKKDCPGWNSQINLERDKIPIPRQVPKEIVFEITKRCNLKCRNCTSQDKGKEDISYKAAKKIMDAAKKNGVKSIRFTGGEPLLHKEFELMLNYAKKCSFYVTLNTNAVSLKQKQIKSISEKADNILVSLQGFDQQSNDYLTKSHSSFNEKLANIIKLKKKSRGVVRLGTVISKTLIENFHRYLRLIKKIGIDNWELYRPLAGGSYKQGLTKKECRKITDVVLRLKNSGTKVRIGNPLPFCAGGNMHLSKLVFLGAIAENTRMVLDTKGYFKPSYFTDYNLGRDLTGAWRKFILLNKRLQKNLPAQCRECDCLKWCAGGIRTMESRGKRSRFLNDLLAPKKTDG